MRARSSGWREMPCASRLPPRANPVADAAIAGLEGQRPLRPEFERLLANRLREHGSVVHGADSPARMKARTWPYLARQVEALNAACTVIVPLHSADAVYGALGRDLLGARVRSACAISPADRGRRCPRVGSPSNVPKR